MGRRRSSSAARSRATATSVTSTRSTLDPVARSRGLVSSRAARSATRSRASVRMATRSLSSVRTRPTMTRSRPSGSWISSGRNASGWRALVRTARSARSPGRPTAAGSHSRPRSIRPASSPAGHARSRDAVRRKGRMPTRRWRGTSPAPIGAGTRRDIATGGRTCSSWKRRPAGRARSPLGTGVSPISPGIRMAIRSPSRATEAPNPIATRGRRSGRWMSTTRRQSRVRSLPRVAGPRVRRGHLTVRGSPPRACSTRSHSTT